MGSSSTPRSRRLLHARFVSGRKDSTAIVFVEDDYNVYYVPDVAADKKKVYPLSPTETTIPDVVIHGVPDWLYEGRSVVISISLCHSNSVELLFSFFFFEKQEIGDRKEDQLSSFNFFLPMSFLRIIPLLASILIILLSYLSCTCYKGFIEKKKLFFLMQYACIYINSVFKAINNSRDRYFSCRGHFKV